MVRGEEGILPLGEAAVLRSGDEVTLLSLGQMVPVALAAAQMLEAEGISAEVVDLRTLRPWDRETVLTSVARTRRAVIVEENPASGGWGHEPASVIGAELFGELLAPVHRVTTPDVPVPFSRELELNYLPTPEYVTSQVTSLCNTARSPHPWWEEPS